MPPAGEPGPNSVVPRPRSRTMRRLLTVAIGVGVGALLVVATVSPGVFLGSRTCVLGQRIGTYTVFSPIFLANIPDGGFANVSLAGWNYTFASGSVSVGAIEASDGSIGVAHVVPYAGIQAAWWDVNWTFYSTMNTSSGGAVSHPCTQPYIAENGGGLGCGGFVVMPIANNSSDASDPHFWSGEGAFNGSESYPGCPTQTPGTSVWFNTSFGWSSSESSPPPTIDLCQSARYFPETVSGTVNIPIQIFVPFDGRNISASGDLIWSSFDYNGQPTISYELAPGYWYEMSPIGPTQEQTGQSFPGPSSIAFERFNCTPADSE